MRRSVFLRARVPLQDKQSVPQSSGAVLTAQCVCVCARTSESDSEELEEDDDEESLELSEAMPVDS